MGNGGTRCAVAPRTGVLRGEARARAPARRSYVVLVNWTLLQICVAVLLNRRAGGAAVPAALASVLLSRMKTCLAVPWRESMLRENESTLLLREDRAWSALSARVFSRRDNAGG